MLPYRLFVFSFLVMTAMSITTVSFAQERQMGGIGLTVFADSNFRGKSATFREDVPNLKGSGLNDKISSLRVAPGEQWEVCEHPNYKGRCVVVSGEEPQLQKTLWSDVISSVRRVGSETRPPVVRPEPPSPNDWYIVLYDQPTYRGSPKNYKGSVANTGWHQRVQSVTIGKGVWELCEGENFTGHCVILDKNVPDLSAYGFSDRVTSLRPAIKQPR